LTKPKSMEPKVVIITGASSGIGLACAREFARNGYNIVLAARNTQKLTDIESELLQKGVAVLSVVTDVSHEEDCKNLIEAAVTRFGRIDVLLNNAGISMRAAFLKVDLDVLHKLMNTNFWGTVYCTKYALPYLLQTRGSVVGVSSIAGYMGLPGRTGYSASKFAMQGFLETIRIEHLKQGLHVMIVAPGFTTSNIRKTALAADGSEQGESPREESKMMSAETVASHIFKGVQKRKRRIILSFIGKIGIFVKQYCSWLTDRVEYRAMKREPNSPLV
jgi:short-subunit dehydrogenase